MIRLTMLGVLLLAAPVRPQDAVNTIGKAQMNLQIATFWAQHGKPMAKAQLTESLLGLADKFYDLGNTKVWTYEVSGINIEISPPPGFEKLDFNKIQFRLPLAASWQVKFSVNLKVKRKVLFFWVTKKFKLTALVANVWARAKADLNSSDPEAPKVATVHKPEVHFILLLWTNEWYLNVLSAILTPFVNQKLKQMMDGALDSLMPALASVEGGPSPFGVGGPGVAPPESYDYKTPALKISQKVGLHHLPYKTLLSANFAAPYTGAWEESWDVAPGPITGHGGYGDSAIWTGHALAAEAFRYKMTGDPAAKALALTMLQGIDIITQNKGVPGLLNRAVQYPSVTGAPTGDSYVNVWEGVEYVCHDFISRDQYMGVFFGCSAAYDFIDDPEIKALAKANIERMLDYLLANKWVAYRKDGTISTTWLMQFAQELAWVLAGRRVNPSKYLGAYAQHAFLADLAWLAPWTETFDPVGSYYKFNLEHGAFYTFLRLETNPVLWARGYKGFRILRKAIGHHLQAHFNMCEIGVAPWTAATYGPETRSLLRLFLKRHRRSVAFTVTGVDTVVYTPLSLGFSLDSGGSSTPPAPEVIAKFPLPPDKRGSTDFLWQRDPFGLNSGGDGTEEEPGIDYTLPYWMGRYYGVFGE